MLSKSPKIEFLPDYSQNCLKIKLSGRLTKDTTKLACEALANEFNKYGAYNHYVIVLDCTNVTGFDKLAKREWLRFINSIQQKISKVVVVSKNIFIGAAAHLTLKLFPFENQLARSFNSLNLLNIHCLKVA